MNQAIDVVVFGNPNYLQLPIIQTATEFDHLIPSITETKCPKNYSELVKDELNTLVEYQKEFTRLSEDTKKRYELYDTNLSQAIKRLFKSHGDSTNDLIDEIIESTLPLLLKIKFKYNRPRPQVLANYYKASLFPKISASSDTPSFPSGHTFQMEVVKETLGAMYPQRYEYLKAMANEVSEQRLFYGLHYPSDIDFAKLCAKKLIQSKEWNKKYNL